MLPGKIGLPESVFSTLAKNAALNLGIKDLAEGIVSFELLLMQAQINFMSPSARDIEMHKLPGVHLEHAPRAVKFPFSIKGTITLSEVLAYSGQSDAILFMDVPRGDGLSQRSLWLNILFKAGGRVNSKPVVIDIIFPATLSDT